MWITDFEIKFLDWKNSGTDNEFCKNMSISRKNRMISLYTLNGKGEKIFEKTIKLLPRELSVICGLIRMKDDLYWRQETYMSEEIGIITWKIILVNENRTKCLIGTSDFPEGFEHLIKYSSSSFGNKEDGFELRKFFEFLYRYERTNL